MNNNILPTKPNLFMFNYRRFQINNSYFRCFGLLCNFNVYIFKIILYLSLYKVFVNLSTAEIL